VGHKTLIQSISGISLAYRGLKQLTNNTQVNTQTRVLEWQVQVCEHNVERAPAECYQEGTQESVLADHVLSHSDTVQLVLQSRVDQQHQITESVNINKMKMFSSIY